MKEKFAGKKCYMNNKQKRHGEAHTEVNLLKAT